MYIYGMSSPGALSAKAQIFSSPSHRVSPPTWGVGVEHRQSTLVARLRAAQVGGVGGEPHVDVHHGEIRVNLYQTAASNESRVLRQQEVCNLQ